MPRSFRRVVAVLLAFSSVACAQQDLSSFRDQEGDFLIGPDVSATFTDLHLNSIDDGQRKNIVQRGDVSARQVRINDGTYTIESGSLTTRRLALGEPQLIGLMLSNFGGQVMISPDPLPLFVPGPAPVSLPRLDLRSSLGNLVPIPEDLFEQVPFEIITSNTPSLITLESPIQPLTIDEPIFLPIEFQGSADQGDFWASVGESDQSLESHFRQIGGTVAIRGDLELCVPAGVSTPIVDISNGITTRVFYEHHGGELHVNRDMVVASNGIVPAEFLQTAGSTIVDHSLRVSGISGTLRLQSGTLTARSINAFGNLVMGDTALMIVDELTLGGNFTAEDGGSIRIQGQGLTLSDDAFSMRTTDRRGLSKTELIFDAGPDRKSWFNYGEVFIQSNLDAPNGNRLRIGKLRVGDQEPTTLRFQPYYNGLDFNIGTLELAPGSTLELDGTKLHYEKLVLGEGAKILDADCNDDRWVDGGDLRCMTSNTVDYITQRLEITPGDFNADGEVNFADFTVLSANYGNDVADYTHGDANANGMVEFDDFLALSNAYGKQAGTNWSFSLQSVPEPSSNPFVLLLVVATVITHRRQHSIFRC